MLENSEVHFGLVLHLVQARRAAVLFLFVLCFKFIHLLAGLLKQFLLLLGELVELADLLLVHRLIDDDLRLDIIVLEFKRLDPCQKLLILGLDGLDPLLDLVLQVLYVLLVLIYLVVVLRLKVNLVRDGILGVEQLVN